MKTVATMNVEMEVHGIVTRCGCGNPASHANNPCQNPRGIYVMGDMQTWALRHPILYIKQIFKQIFNKN